MLAHCTYLDFRLVLNFLTKLFRCTTFLYIVYLNSVIEKFSTSHYFIFLLLFFNWIYQPKNFAHFARGCWPSIGFLQDVSKPNYLNFHGQENIIEAAKILASEQHRITYPFQSEEIFTVFVNLRRKQFQIAKWPCDIMQNDLVTLKS